jgi:hypothetical protein
MNERTAAARAADTDGLQADDAAVEERARRIGWVPKDEFRGDPAKWSPAADYLERGERTLPILLERNRKLDDKLGRVEKDYKAVKTQLDEMTDTLKEARDTFVEFRQSTANVEQRAYQRAREDIMAERDAAVAAADPAAFKAADAKLVELDKTAPKAPPEREVTRDDRRGEREDDRRAERRDDRDAPQVSATAQAWIDDNPWFKTDTKAGTKAVALHGANLAAGMSEDESLADVRLSIEAMRPDLFDKGGRREDDDIIEEPRRGAPAVQQPSGGARRRRGNGRSFEDLPQEAKDAYTRFQKQDPKFTKEDYLRDYIWD